MPVRREEVKQHSELAPSGSKRWLHCNGSITVNRTGGRSSHYAELGTAAHELLELCMRLDVDPSRYLGKVIYKDFVVNDDMVAAVGQAMDWVNAYVARHPAAEVSVEKRVDPAPLLKCEKGRCSGTLDLSIRDKKNKRLIIIDYKHGANVSVEVEAEGDDTDEAVEFNTQLMLYLVGELAQAVQPYEEYKLVVIQPRSRHEDGPVREAVVTHAQLKEFIKFVQSRLRSIDKNPDERKAGSWCLFCAGAGRCRTLAEHNLNVAKSEFGDLTEEAAAKDPREMTDKELAWAVKNIKVFDKWLKALHGYALEYMLAGNTLPDRKLVLGRKQRYFANEKEVIKLLKRMKFDEDEFAPRSLIGVPGVEDLFAKRRSEAGVRLKKDQPRMPQPFYELINYTKPKIHIADSSDPRPAVERGQEFSELPLPDATKGHKARS
jgi:hypothetical protein